MRPLVLLDVDGVTFDFDRAFFQRIEKHFGVRYEQAGNEFDYEDLPGWSTAFWGLCEMEGFASTPGCIYPGAVEGVDALREIADVEVCTSPYKKSLTWCGERVAWLGQNFGFKPDEIHFTHKKYRMFADYLVDDRALNAEQFGPKKGILWTRSYNLHSDHPIRVSNWDEVLEVVRCNS